MSTRVDADPATLEHLRLILGSFWEAQASALDVVLLEYERTRLDLEQARQRCQAELERCQTELRRCFQEQAFAAQQGGYVDCSSLEWALREAEDRLATVENAVRDVDAAGERFRAQEHLHRAWLADHIPAMQAGLRARADSLESYLAWTVGGGQWSSGQGFSGTAPKTPGRDQPEHGIRRYPVERREGNIGGPEREG